MNSILMNLIFRPWTGRDVVKIFRDKPRVRFDAGQPAEWVIHGDEQARRKAGAKAVDLQAEDKEGQREEQAQKRTKERDKVERIASEKITSVSLNKFVTMLIEKSICLKWSNESVCGRRQLSKNAKVWQQRKQQ